MPMPVPEVIQVPVAVAVEAVIGTTATGSANPFNGISLGSGNFTLDDDAYGSSTITEDPKGSGIVTAASPTGSPKLQFNITEATDTDVELNTAPNSIASAYAVTVTGDATDGGTTGNFGYRSTAAGAGPGPVDCVDLEALVLRLAEPALAARGRRPAPTAVLLAVLRERAC